MIDPGIAAFVTNLAKPYPIHVHIVGIGMLILAILSFIKGIRSRDTWAFAIYILFAILRIIVGFGLATYAYDLYLYAGHYLFVCLRCLLPKRRTSDSTSSDRHHDPVPADHLSEQYRIARTDA